MPRDELDRQAQLHRLRSSHLQQAQRGIDTDHPGALLGCQHCGVPGSATEIEHAFARLQRRLLDDRDRGGQQLLRRGLVPAESPVEPSRLALFHGRQRTDLNDASLLAACRTARGMVAPTVGRLTRTVVRLPRLGVRLGAPGIR